MKKLLFTLLFFPSLAFSQTWLTDIKTDKIYDNKINYIYNKPNNVLISCSNQQINIDFLFPEYIGITSNVTFVYRTNKDEPDKLYDGVPDNKKVKFIDNSQFIKDLVYANSITVRATTEYGGSQMYINPNGFNSALKKAPECLNALKRYEYQRNIKSNNVNYKLIIRDGDTLFFADRENKTVNGEYVLFTYDGTNKEFPDMRLSVINIDCKKNSFKFIGKTSLYFDNPKPIKFYLFDNQETYDFGEETPLHEVKKYICDDNFQLNINSNKVFETIVEMMVYSNDIIN